MDRRRPSRPRVSPRRSTSCSRSTERASSSTRRARRRRRRNERHIEAHRTDAASRDRCGHESIASRSASAGDPPPRGAARGRDRTGAHREGPGGVKRLLLAVALVVSAATAAGAADKIFVYHLAAAPDVLDPAKCNNARCQRVMWAIYEPLVNLSKDLRSVLPGLAESWDVSADGLTYTFRLRKGVTFHDGSRFTAAVAKVNLE